MAKGDIIFVNRGEYAVSGRASQNENGQADGNFRFRIISGPGAGKNFKLGVPECKHSQVKLVEDEYQGNVFYRFIDAVDTVAEAQAIITTKDAFAKMKTKW